MAPRDNFRSKFLETVFARSARNSRRYELRRYFFQLHTGTPFASRNTSVSVPLTISRARIMSASPSFTFEPVNAISSPLANLTPSYSSPAQAQQVNQRAVELCQ